MEKEIEYINALNSLLAKAGLEKPLNPGDLIFRAKHVEDSAEYKITRFLNEMLPAPRIEGSFYHFTKYSAMESMLEDNNKTIWLTSIGKNFSSDEIRQSLETAGLDYPLQIDPSSTKPRFHKFYESNVFIASFISGPLDPDEENLLWSEFGQGGHGTRLRFKIKCNGGFFRPITYNPSNKAFKTFDSINRLTKKILGLNFYWDDEVIAFAMALPLKYEHERETRLIVRSGDPQNIFKGDRWNHVKIPIDGRMAVNGLTIELDEICTNRPVPDAYKSLVVAPI